MEEKPNIWQQERWSTEQRKAEPLDEQAKSLAPTTGPDLCSTETAEKMNVARLFGYSNLVSPFNYHTGFFQMKVPLHADL